MSDYNIESIDNIKFRISNRELKQIENFILNQNLDLIEFINKKEKLSNINKIKLSLKK